MRSERPDMDASNIISIIALVVSLLAGAVATWVSHQSSQAGVVTTSYASATAMVLEVDKLLLDFPKFRPYLYESKRLTDSDPDRDKILAAGEMVLDIAEYIWDLERREDPEQQHAWQSWLLSLFDSSPVMRDGYEEHTDWYPNLLLLREESP